MVEGAADQVLLAGTATFLKASGLTEFYTLDLNRITIVPAGSANHVPYLVYLARGRDYEKPAVIVLLDSDDEGNKAKRDLLKAGPLKKLKLREEFILQVQDVAKSLPRVPSGVPAAVDIEDFVPLEICIKAVGEYFAEITVEEKPDLSTLTVDSIRQKFQPGVSAFDAIAAACQAIDAGLHVDKIGFARAVLRVIHTLAKDDSGNTALKEFREGMKALLTRLASMQRAAMRELTQDRVTQQVDRARKTFQQDHPLTARKEEAIDLFDHIESTLDDSIESDEVRLKLEQIRRRFTLTEDPMKPIENYDQFFEELGRIKYVDLLEADAAGRDTPPPSPTKATDAKAAAGEAKPEEAVAAPKPS